MKDKRMKQEEAQWRAESTTFVAPEKPCSTCKYHDNRPSYCRILKEFVGRKHTCEEYKHGR